MDKIKEKMLSQLIQTKPYEAKNKSKPKKISVIYNFGDATNLYEYLKTQSKDGNGKWDNIEIVIDNNPDYYIVLNSPVLRSNGKLQYHEQSKTIIFPGEPRPTRFDCKDLAFQYDPRYLKFCSFDNYLNIGLFWIGKTYSQLKKIKIKKTKTLSAITRAKDFHLEGRRKIIDFIKFLEKKNPSFLRDRFDVFGEHNIFNYKNYKGPLKTMAKYGGLFPYKYTLAIENYSEKNYITEKLYDGLLAECLCFYWGAPNIEEWIDPMALIRLNLNNFEEAYQTIKKTIENKEWEKRIKYIKKEKQKVLDKYNFFPVVQSVINDIESQINKKRVSVLTMVKYYIKYRTIYPIILTIKYFLSSFYKFSKYLKNKFRWYEKAIDFIKK